MKILIVDDEPFSRRLVEGYLRRSGYEAVTAAGAREALQRLEEDADIALLVTDWMMPEVDGLELCRAARVQKRERYLPILLLTSRSEKEDLVAGLGAGADAFLSKPVDFAELQAHLRVAERILSLEKELAAAAEERAQLRELQAITATARTLTDRINNPMMAIFGQCDLLRLSAEKLSPGEVAALAGRILEAAGRVGDVVHALERVVRPALSEVPNVGAVLDITEATAGR